MKNKSVLTGIIFLLLGLIAGGAAVWLAGGHKAPGTEAVKAERKVLFYRNPMDPEVTSPVFMKDQMGMDYLPVYEDEVDARDSPGTVRITPEKIQKLGVKSAPVERRDITRVIRTVGRVEPAEDLTHAVTAKVSGWIEKLYVDRTDAMVEKGDRLLELYSPELVSAQEEYLVALAGLERVKDSPFAETVSGAKALVEASRQKLEYLDISDDQIQRLAKQKTISRTLTIRSPATGSVTEKMAVEGQKIATGEPLAKIVDHGKVWVFGEVYEYEMPYVKAGQKAALTPSYSPSKARSATIEHIYTHLGSIRYSSEEATAESRTVKVRFALDNRDHALKLGMYMNIELKVMAARGALTVPETAVMDTGTRKLVIIDRKDGTFEPREITTGSEGEGVWEVRHGLKEGEFVVTSANFLLDSESNLRAALSSMKKDSGMKPVKRDDTHDSPPAAEHRH